VMAIARLGRDYWLAALAVGQLLLANLLLVRPFASRISAADIPVVSGWLAETVTSFFPIVAARVLGVLLHVRGDSVGLGDPDHYREPVLGAAQPRGAEPVLETVAPEPARVTAIELEPEPTAAVAPAPAAPVEPAPAADPVRAIEEAVVASDGPRAAALFATYRGPASAIAPRTLFLVARAAADAGQHALSARALHAAGSAPDAAVAPNALLVLARVLERRLGRGGDARKVLAHLVARWPASDAARQARELLGAPPAA